MEDKHKDIKEIPVPASLSEEQVRLAKAFVIDRHENNTPVAEFLAKHHKGKNTWYKWINENPVFASYLKALGNTVANDEERESYQIVKRKIMENATKKDASPRDIELYLTHFEYVILAEKQERMRELGITPEHEKGNQKSFEERRNILLSRLKG